MKPVYETVKQYVEEHRREMLCLWEDFVNTPSQARDRAAAMKMADKLMDIFSVMGMDVRSVDVGPVNSRLIVADWNTAAPGAPILISGHYDTVNACPDESAVPGTETALDGTTHFRVDAEGKAHGLGCLDMQGGIVVAIWALRALQALGWNKHPVRFLFAGDEDKGHEHGNTPEKMMELAKGCACCFNMETGLITNEICIGRKGGGQGDVEITGKAAHAGNEFSSGRNALLEMTYIAQELAALTDLEKGTTVAPTLIRGGSVPNGIPELCTMSFDVRYNCESEKQRLLKAFEEIGSTTHIEGTHCKLVFREFMSPFEKTPRGEALADFVAAVSQRSGLGTMGKKVLGGSSDASYLTMAGVPTICSMGVCGQYNHSSKEYAFVESLYTRTKLLTCALMELDEYLDS